MNFRLARNLFLNLCQFDSIMRYATFEALKHPWITRNSLDQIPLTILQKYNRKKLVKSFKEVSSNILNIVHF